MHLHVYTPTTVYAYTQNPTFLDSFTIFGGWQVACGNPTRRCVQQKFILWLLPVLCLLWPASGTDGEGNFMVSHIVSASSTLSTGPTWTVCAIFRDAASLCCPDHIIYYRNLGIKGRSSIKMVNAKKSYSCPYTFPHAKCPMGCLAKSVHSLVFCWYLCGCLHLSESPPSSLVHLGLEIRDWLLALCFLSPPDLVLQPLGFYLMVPDHRMPLT